LNPDAQSVMTQLARVLASPVFAPAPRLCRFLEYVVEETLAGRNASVKEYTIGSIVFGRGVEFNPRTDPIVRVQARNLRARLERYYAGPGVDDPVRIELPKGTYVPVFAAREVKRSSRKWLVSAAIALAALLALLSVAVLEVREIAARHQMGTSRLYLSP
jgi:hypothetical protein